MITTHKIKSLTSDSNGMLHREVCYLHFRMFRRPASDGIIEKYTRAHAEIPDLHYLNNSQLSTVEKIVVAQLDAVGIEPWLRRKGSRHALSAKLLLLAYLSECDANHFEFARPPLNKRMPILHMGIAMMNATLQLLRGFIQKARHGLL